MSFSIIEAESKVKYITWDFCRQLHVDDAL